MKGNEEPTLATLHPKEEALASVNRRATQLAAHL